MKAILRAVAISVAVLAVTTPTKADNPAFISGDVTYTYNEGTDEFYVEVSGYINVPTGWSLESPGSKSCTWIEPAGADSGMESLSLDGTGNVRSFYSGFAVNAFDGLWEFQLQWIFRDGSNQEFILDESLFKVMEKP